MQVVYYYDQYLGFCPVGEYFNKYVVLDKDSNKIRKEKILASIAAKIEYIRDNNGQPLPPQSKPSRGFSFFEIFNPKDANTVIRIVYFCYDDKMILLHDFEKPAKYNTNKIKKYVLRQYFLDEKYLNIFKLNPQNYEKYN